MKGSALAASTPRRFRGDEEWKAMHVIGPRADAVFDWFVVIVLIAFIPFMVWQIGRGWIW